MKLEDLRAQLLLAILNEVPFEGWTPRALARAATLVDASTVDLARAFPEGPLGALVYWNRKLDAVSVKAIAAAGNLKIREKVTLGIRARLEAAAPHKEAVRRGLGVLALPGHAKTSVELLIGTLNAIWYAAGDQSTDFGYYTKRGLLAGIFLTSLLYWLDDDSEGGQGSWAFLDRQIASALRLPTLFAPFREGLKNFFPCAMSANG